MASQQISVNDLFSALSLQSSAYTCLGSGTKGQFDLGVYLPIAQRIHFGVDLSLNALLKLVLGSSYTGWTCDDERERNLAVLASQVKAALNFSVAGKFIETAAKEMEQLGNCGRNLHDSIQGPLFGEPLALLRSSPQIHFKKKQALYLYEWAVFILNQVTIIFLSKVPELIASKEYLERTGYYKDYDVVINGDEISVKGVDRMIFKLL